MCFFVLDLKEKKKIFYLFLFYFKFQPCYMMYVLLKHQLVLVIHFFDIVYTYVSLLIDCSLIHLISIQLF